MKKNITSFLLIFVFLHFSTPAKSQLPYNCNSNTRIAIAGDSWAQYMADDDTHNNTLSMYGHGDKQAISETFEMPIGCTGSPGPIDYAVSGSEAREWKDEINYNYLQNLIDAINANTNIDYVLLSIGGNDILAARSGGGWYKNMDLDVPGSEAALFDTITAHTEYIMNEVWSRGRSNIKFIISSYDFPNFNVVGGFLGFDYCEQYACPKREDLSRDDNDNGEIDPEELITDAEINAMMDVVEGIRKSMANANPQILYDNGMGLMHYYYGYDDGLYPDIPSGTTTYPQGQSPYATGGDLNTPTDRDNFRGVSLCGIFGNFPADPIHLDAEGYEYKIKNQFDNIFFESFRGLPDETVWSVGSEDGYVDIEAETATSNGIRVGDNDTGWPGLDNEYRGILSFNTEPIPDGSTITGASLYLIRSSENDNPFLHSDRYPILDIKSGYFGDDASLVWTDGTAAADASDIGCFHGDADENKYAIRVDLDAPALDYINMTGTTQLRMYFSYADWSPEYINFYDGDGVEALLPPEEEERQNPTVYKYRVVKQSVNATGEIIEEVIEKGKPITKREGYVYQEKLQDISQNDDGDIVMSFQMVVAIEHPGLAKHMSDTYNAPANGYAPFLDITYQLPLPVEFTAFSASAKNQHTLLNWKTASESNTSGFFVEHSTDSKSWEDLDFVNANGSSSMLEEYDYTHYNPVLGDNYYRLRVLDFDDDYEYSEIRMVNFEKENQLVGVRPNPFRDRLSLTLDLAKSGKATVELSDVLGRVVLSRNINVISGAQEYVMEDLNTLSKGAYVIRVFDGVEVFVGKVVKH